MEGRLLAILDAGRSRRALTRVTLVAAVLVAACVVTPLAALRLAGRAVGSAEAAEKPAPALKATLPSGVEVELVGISYHPSKGRPWWRPDGSPLSEAPYDSLGVRAHGHGARGRVGEEGLDGGGIHVRAIVVARGGRSPPPGGARSRAGASRWPRRWPN